MTAGADHEGGRPEKDRKLSERGKKLQSKKQALLAGIGFGWMPLYLVEKTLKAGQLVEVNYQHGSRFSFTPHLVWRADNPLGKTGQKFIEKLLAQQAELRTD